MEGLDTRHIPRPGIGLDELASTSDEDFGTDQLCVEIDAAPPMLLDHALPVKFAEISGEWHQLGHPHLPLAVLFHPSSLGDFGVELNVVEDVGLLLAADTFQILLNLFAGRE